MRESTMCLCLPRLDFCVLAYKTASRNTLMWKQWCLLPDKGRLASRYGKIDRISATSCCHLITTKPNKQLSPNAHFPLRSVEDAKCRLAHMRKLKEIRSSL